MRAAKEKKVVASWGSIKFINLYWLFYTNLSKRNSIYLIIQRIDIPTNNNFFFLLFYILTNLTVIVVPGSFRHKGWRTNVNVDTVDVVDFRIPSDWSQVKNLFKKKWNSLVGIVFKTARYTKKVILFFLSITLYIVRTDPTSPHHLYTVLSFLLHSIILYAPYHPWVGEPALYNHQWFYYRTDRTTATIR